MYIWHLFKCVFQQTYVKSWLFEQAVDSDSDTESGSSEFGQTQQAELVQY